MYPVRSPDGCTLLTDIDEQAIIDETKIRITNAILNFFIRNPSRKVLLMQVYEINFKKVY